jgi:hypothetical protein
MTAPVWTDHAFVVLAYKDSPFLTDCLRSLAMQRTPSEIIIATSTPSDFIAAAAVSFGVKLIVNPVQAGIGADWNFGLNVSPRRFVTLAHQDDLYDRNFLHQTQIAFSKRPEGVVCFTGYQEIDDAGRPKRSKISRVKHLLSLATLGRRRRVQGLRLRAFLSFGNPLPCSSVTFDRSRLKDFAFREDMVSNLDWDAWLRLCRTGAILLHEPGRLVGRRHNAITETRRLIETGYRQQEDAVMFGRLWPPPIARALALAYRASY